MSRWERLQKRLQTEGDTWKSPLRPDWTEADRGKSKGNDGEGTELTGTAPECHTRNRASF